MTKDKIEINTSLERCKRYFFVILGGAIVLLVIIYFVWHRNEPLARESAWHSDVVGAVNKGVNFLDSNQMATGEFPTIACSGDGADRLICVQESSTPFTTAVTLNALSIAEKNTEALRNIFSRGQSFLSNQSNNGIWHFYNVAPEAKLRKLCPPDMDDTALVSQVLYQNDVSFSDNIDLILSNRNSEGLFFTWIMPDNVQPWPFLIIKSNDVDCAVNANIVSYLRVRVRLQADQTKIITNYLRQAIDSELSCSRYYPNGLVVDYFIAKAYQNGVDEFITLRPIIEKHIKKNINNSNGCMNGGIDNALALNILLKFKSNVLGIKPLADCLLRQQNHDGSWPSERFADANYNRQFSSQAVTTAWAVEALLEYQKTLVNNK